MPCREQICDEVNQWVGIDADAPALIEIRRLEPTAVPMRRRRNLDNGRNIWDRHGERRAAIDDRMFAGDDEFGYGMCAD